MKKLNNPIFIKFLLVSVLAYIVADLAQLQIRKILFPKAAGLKLTATTDLSFANSSSQYYAILERNIFSAKNIIPTPLSKKEQIAKKQALPSGEPVASSLSIKLLGTIVNSLPNYSVATVSLSQNSAAEAYSVKDTIKNLAIITEIHRGKIIFKNLNSNRLEYIKIPEKTQFQFFTKTPLNEANIQEELPGSYKIARKTINKYLKPKNLRKLLRQAHVIPNIISRNPTKIDGFRFAQIKKGSIFETLGFKPNDTILEIDGQPAHGTPPWELFNKYKNSSHLRLKIRRNGQVKEFTYNIN
ncbi:MAG: hypothetical protein HAW63_00570 [Bdellovibrionaceae bacterium]|nr:hypothetical protein [Pseudobdellovibrionaceae bacterium]